MKKLILAFVLALATSMSITSCTEEVITPTNENGTTGGGNGGTDDPKP